MEYRKLQVEEINRRLFLQFERRQQVTACWRKVEDEWVIREVVFVDEWNEEEYFELIRCLKNTIVTGGVVFAAFLAGELKGFASVESNPFGAQLEYLDLTSLHVSEDMRGQGIGKNLFQSAKSWAISQGARKLYISAHSAVETQAFYRGVGCAEAEEYSQEHVEREPWDCQLECSLIK